MSWALHSAKYHHRSLISSLSLWAVFWLSLMTSSHLICDFTWKRGTGNVMSYSSIVFACANWLHFPRTWYVRKNIYLILVITHSSVFWFQYSDAWLWMNKVHIGNRCYQNTKTFQLITPQTNHLTNGGRVTHTCVGNLTIIGFDNGLSPAAPFTNMD